MCVCVIRVCVCARASIVLILNSTRRAAVCYYWREAFARQRRVLSPFCGACICVDLMRARERREVLVDVVARSGYYGESYLVCVLLFRRITKHPPRLTSRGGFGCAPGARENAHKPPQRVLVATASESRSAVHTAHADKGRSDARTARRRQCSTSRLHRNPTCNNVCCELRPNRDSRLARPHGQ